MTRTFALVAGMEADIEIVILGAGVQGTVFAVRLSIVGHQVTLVARPDRAAELRREGASIQDAATSLIRTRCYPFSKSSRQNGCRYMLGHGAP